MLVFKFQWNFAHEGFKIVCLKYGLSRNDNKFVIFQDMIQSFPHKCSNILRINTLILNFNFIIKRDMKLKQTMQNNEQTMIISKQINLNGMLKMVTTSTS